MSKKALLHGYDVSSAGDVRALDVVASQGHPEAGWYRWIHLELDDEESITWLAQFAELPPEVATALASTHPRPHVERVGGGVVLVLRAVNPDPGAVSEEMVALLAWIESDRVLTLRRDPLAALQKVEARMQQGTAPTSPASLIAALVDEMQSRIDGAVGSLEDRLDDIESRAAEGELTSAEVSDLSDVRRHAVTIRRHLAPQALALADLLHVGLGFDQEHRLSELAQRTRRHVDMLDSIRERAGVTQEEQSHHLADRLNRRMYALTVVAGIFLPLGFLTGLLGINVAGIPFAEHPWSFAIVAGACIALLGVEIWFFRRRGWL